MDVNKFFVANPCMPYTYFPYDLDKDEVAFALLFDGDCSRVQVEKMCGDIKQELHLTYFDWGYCAGRCLLTLKKCELPRVYDIVRAFLRRDRRIYMQDGTQVTWSGNGETIVSPEEQQKILLALLKRLLGGQSDRQSFQHATELLSLPVHRDKFWLIDEGKAFAAQYRQACELDDAIDPKSMSIGEYFAERSKAIH